MRAAKKRLLEKAGDRNWLLAVGISKLDSKLGLKVSVRPGTKGAATRVINGLQLRVPVRVRTVTDIRKLPAKGGAKRTKPAKAGAELVQQLRKQALRRLEG